MPIFTNHGSEESRPLTQCGVCLRQEALTPLETHKEFALYECGGCCGQFWSPMQNPGAEWYSRDERYSFRNNAPLKRPERNHREFLRDLPVRGGRLLDVGMGTGNFMLAARKAGYDVYGIDFDEEAIASAKEHFGLQNVFVADVDGALTRFGVGYFDVMTMFEVLEHLDKPREFIEKVSSLLKFDGHLAVSVPHREAPAYLKPHDLPPRHLTRWNETAIRNFFEGRGFEIVAIRTIPPPLNYLITKFHFWTRGYLSFGLTRSAAVVGASSAKKSAGITKRLSFLRCLARTKDVTLFIFPAIILKLWLIVSGQNKLGLYALARKASRLKVLERVL